MLSPNGCEKSKNIIANYRNSANENITDSVAYIGHLSAISQQYLPLTGL
jgi:hypothetical protein